MVLCLNLFCSFYLEVTWPQELANLCFAFEGNLKAAMGDLEAARSRQARRNLPRNLDKQHFLNTDVDQFRVKPLLRLS